MAEITKVPPGEAVGARDMEEWAQRRRGGQASVRNKKWDDTNRGALFNAVDRKQTDKHPDYSGQLNVDGEEYWLSGWVKTSRAGEKYLSLSIQAKYSPKRKEVVQQRTAGNGASARDDDDLDGLAF